MNRHEFEANWSQLKGSIPAKWNKFLPEDMARLDGKYEPFLGHLQKKYGLSREQAENEIKNWAAPAQGSKVEKIAPCSAKCDERKEKKRKAG